MRSRLCIREVAWSKDSYGQRLAVTVNLKGAHMPRYAQPPSGRPQAKANNRKNKKNKKNKKNGRGKSQRGEEDDEESEGADDEEIKGGEKKRGRNNRKSTKSPMRRKSRNVKQIKAAVLAGQEGEEREQQEDEEEEEEKGSGGSKGKDATTADQEEETREDSNNNSSNNHNNHRMDANTWQLTEFGGKPLRPGEDLILIYSVQVQPSLRFTPRGFLRGPPGACKPYNLDFWPSCTTGALLSACWLNGEVTVHPLMYETQRRLQHALDGERQGFRSMPDEYDDEEAMEMERLAAESQLIRDRSEW